MDISVRSKLQMKLNGEYLMKGSYGERYRTTTFRTVVTMIW